MKKIIDNSENFNIELRYYADGSIMVNCYNKFIFKKSHQHIPKEMVDKLKEIFALENNCVPKEKKQ